MVNQSWRDRAACRGCRSDLFFPDKGGEKAFDQGKKICGACGVRRQCLELAEAFAHFGDRYGLFGGLTPNERKQRRRDDVRKVYLRHR